MPSDQNPKAAQAIADGKLPLDLIDTALTHPASRVLASGAAKYGVRNWRKVPINASTYVGALRRHTDEWADGIDADHDSGEHPLAHIVATCNVVLDAIKHGTLVDDRGDSEAKTAPERPSVMVVDCGGLRILSDLVDEADVGTTFINFNGATSAAAPRLYCCCGCRRVNDMCSIGPCTGAVKL